MKKKLRRWARETKKKHLMASWMVALAINLYVLERDGMLYCHRTSACSHTCEFTAVIRSVKKERDEIDFFSIDLSFFSANFIRGGKFIGRIFPWGIFFMRIYARCSEWISWFFFLISIFSATACLLYNVK